MGIEAEEGSSIKSWRLLPSASRTHEILSSGLSITHYEVPVCPAVAGRRILFITDFHVMTATTWSLAPWRGGLISWRGLDWLKSSLEDAFNRHKPDLIVFGGDLVVHSCWLKPVMEFFKQFAKGVPKFAVMGNWDKRRRRWLPYEIWNSLYEEAGFKLLINSEFNLDGLRLYGMDDFKMGYPSYAKAGDGVRFNCVISHNPDAVLRNLNADALSEIDLILCGHTHGGQWRLPFFGAFARSSAYWLGFDYGAFEHRISKTKLVVCSGIGSTGFRSRLNCPPEIVLLELTGKGA